MKDKFDYLSHTDSKLKYTDTNNSIYFRQDLIDENNLPSNSYNQIVFVPNNQSDNLLGFAANGSYLSFKHPSISNHSGLTYLTNKLAINPMQTTDNQEELNKLLKQKAATLVHTNDKSFKIKRDPCQNHKSSKSSEKSQKINLMNKCNLLCSASSSGGVTTVSTTSASTSSSSSNSAADDQIVNSDSFIQANINNQYQKLFFHTNNSNNYQENIMNKTYVNTMNRNLTGIIYNTDNTLSSSPKFIQIVNLNNENQIQQQNLYECIQLVNLTQSTILTNSLNKQQYYKSENEENESEQVYDTIDDKLLNQPNFIPNDNARLSFSCKTYEPNNSYSFKKIYPKTNPKYSFNSHRKT
jgi:hypothetical protein